MIFSQDESNLLIYNSLLLIGFTPSVLESEKNVPRSLNSRDDASSKDRVFLF